MNKKLTLLTLLMAPIVGCGGPAGTKPDDMSASEHREKALEHEEAAREETRRYDEKGGDSRTERRPLMDDLSKTVDGNWEDEVHADRQLSRADSEQHVARAHRRAAQALETFVSQQCKGLAPVDRKSCPLLLIVVSAKEAPGGVRLNLVEGSDVSGFVIRLRCHMAYGRLQGRKGMPTCPLYVRGLRVKEVGPLAVELTVDQPEAVRDLRRRVVAHGFPL